MPPSDDVVTDSHAMDALSGEDTDVLSGEDTDTISDAEFDTGHSAVGRTAIDSLEARLAAVERAMTGGDTPVANLDDAETLSRRLDDIESAVENLEDRVAELEAASRALRGYASGIEAVNEDVERRADLAIAKAEAIEQFLRQDPGLQVEHLDPEIEPDSNDFDTRAAADSEHASDADVASAVETAASPNEIDGDTSAEDASTTSLSAQDASTTNAVHRSLAARIRDAL